MKKQELEQIMNNLYLFYRCFITLQFHPNYPASHIRELAEELTRVRLGEYDRLCVSMPPRHSKSSMVTLAYPLWLIFQDPTLNILIINNTGDLSEKFGIQLREYVRKFGGLFNVYLSDVKHSSTHLMFEDNTGELYSGSIRLVGSNGAITGQDADYIIIDDPYKGFDDTTPSLLQKKIDWFNTIVEQRIEPQTRLIILHTRWKTNDLIGHFKKNSPNKYKFLSFPAIKPDGKPLWEARYTRAILDEKRKDIKETLFQAIYQQKPIDDQSNFFKMNLIHYTPLPTEDKIIGRVRGWDTASSDPGKNDFTVGLPMYISDHENILITDYIRGQYGTDTFTTIKNTAEQDGVGTEITIETGVAAAGKLLFHEWEEQLAGYFIEQAMPVPDKSKSDRATPLQNAILMGKVYMDIKDPELRKTLIDEFKSFPNGEHDDIVDAASHAYNYLKKNYISAGSVFEVINI